VCDKCKPMDARISHYRQILKAILDKQTVDGIQQLINEIEAAKKSLHPDPPR